MAPEKSLLLPQESLGFPQEEGLKQQVASFPSVKNQGLSNQ